jgi:hypothetical protein
MCFVNYDLPILMFPTYLVVRFSTDPFVVFSTYLLVIFAT